MHSYLPVYKLAYDFLLQCYQKTDKYPASSKYTIGKEQKEKAMELFMLIYELQVSKKIKDMETVFRIIEVNRILLRLSYDLKLIKYGNYIDANNLLKKISEIVKNIKLRRTQNIQEIEK